MSHLNPCSLPSVTHEMLPLALQVTQCCILQSCQLPMVDMWWKCRKLCQRAWSDKNSSVTFPESCQHTAEFTIWGNVRHNDVPKCERGAGCMKSEPCCICHLLPLSSQGETKPYPTIRYPHVQQHWLTYVPRVVQKEKRCVRLCLPLTHSPSFRPSYGRPNLATFSQLQNIPLLEHIMGIVGAKTLLMSTDRLDSCLADEDWWEKSLGFAQVLHWR